MTEHAPDGFHPTMDDEPAVEPAVVEPADQVTTGLASVDRVLDELDGLDELPLDEHVGAFERAHESLRSALDAPADPAPGDLA
jgi:hypothetical protein